MKLPFFKSRDLRGGTQMKNEIFEKETFIKNVKNTVKSLFRKELSEASQQEI